MRHQLLSFVAVIAIVAAVPAMAGEIEAGSQIDAVTVYPDGATVTHDPARSACRRPRHCSSATFRSRSIHRRCGSKARAVLELIIGAVDGAATAARAGNQSATQIRRRLEALQDSRTALDGEIASAMARRKFAERFTRSVARRPRRKR